MAKSTASSLVTAIPCPHPPRSGTARASAQHSFPEIVEYKQLPLPCCFSQLLIAALRASASEEYPQAPKKLPSKRATAPHRPPRRATGVTSSFSIDPLSAWA